MLAQNIDTMRLFQEDFPLGTATTLPASGTRTAATPALADRNSAGRRNQDGADVTYVVHHRRRCSWTATPRPTRAG
ncbi:MAG: hypothetical protein U5R48_15625 [Gammaproteobacteria bacterium]|nr:hypothetical protein [Gammaproteobacteria bacterium]